MSQHFGVKRNKVSLTITPGAGVTTAQTTGSFNGSLLSALIQAPASVDGSANVVITIVDSDGFTIYTSAPAAAAARVVDKQSGVALSGTYTVIATFSAAQTATPSTTNVTLLVQTN